MTSENLNQSPEEQTASARERNIQLGCVELHGSKRQIEHAECGRYWMFRSGPDSYLQDPHFYSTGTLIELLAYRDIERLKAIPRADWWVAFFGKYDFDKNCPVWFLGIQNRTAMYDFCRALVWNLRWDSPEHEWRDAEERLDLPQLKGSDKQIKWARGIRFRSISKPGCDERFFTSSSAPLLIGLRDEEREEE